MRVVKGIGALLLLLVMLVGAPFALYTLGGSPLPHQWSLTGLWHLLSEPASDRVLIGFIAIIGWIAWAGFAVSVVIELINILSGYRLKIRIPVLHVGQRLTATLVLTIVAMVGASQLAGMVTTPHADAGTVDPSHHAVVAAADVAVQDHDLGETSADPDRGHAVGGLTAPAKDSTRDQDQRSPRSRQIIHVVKAGDFLWDLADQYLGDGARWPEIVKLNDLDSTTIHPGDRLLIPAPLSVTKPGDDAKTVTVGKGDSLSSLSMKLWGSPHRWTDLWQANRDQITDPDQIEIGQVLTVPTADRTITRTEDTKDKESRREDSGDRDSTPNKSDDDRPDPNTDDKNSPGDETDQDRTNGRDDTPTDDGDTEHDDRETTTPPAEDDHTPGTEAKAPASTIVDAPTEDDNQVNTQIAVATASVGLILSAGLVSALAVRRRRQSAARGTGQAPALPGRKALELESRAARVEEPLTIAQLDQALRSIAATAARQDTPELPNLVAARVATAEIHLLHRAPTTAPPPPGVTLEADGSVWVIQHQDLPLLLTAGSLDTLCHPWPALVTLGKSSDDAHILLNLEAVGALSITADDPDQERRAVATLASELAVSPWSSDLNLLLAGNGADLAAAVAHPRVQHVADLDTALDWLENRADEQEPWLSTETVLTKRLDPDLADAWTPTLLMVTGLLTDAQHERLATLVTTHPRVAIAATTSGQPITDWAYHLGGDPLAGRLTVALHDPLEWDLAPTMLSDDDLAHMVELLDTTAETRLEPATWWTAPTVNPFTDEPAPGTAAAPAFDQDTTNPSTGGDTELVAVTEPVPPQPRTPRRRRPLQPLLADLETSAVSVDDIATDNQTNPTHAEEPKDELATTPDLEPDEDDARAVALQAPNIPMLKVFGPPEIESAAGEPTQNPGRCMELMFALLERPGRTTRQLAEQFALSPATIRSVMSYLRSWLGTDPDTDTKWLPDAGPGRGGYRVHDQITSDWHQAQLMLGRAGVAGADTSTLRTILDMVRGRPLEGTSDWTTLEWLKPQIAAFVDDVAHQLTTLALENNDLDLARWANSQGLLAAPESEPLLADKIRIADTLGDDEEVRRLIAKLTANARSLELDLADETQDLLSQLGRR